MSIGELKIGSTRSVCPVCLKTIDADKVLGADKYIYMKKTCPEHGRFSSLIWEGDLKSYLLWNTVSDVVEPPIEAKEAEKGCPNDCGLCSDHLRKGCCMLLELTNRCNLRCPVCFASAGRAEDRDLTLEEIEKQYDYLMAHGGPFNIQLSGGEPTVRDDLPEIIRLGKEKGFTFFQLNTNGLRLAEDSAYAVQLKEAGLTTVFLQFDGLTDDVYEKLRGRPLLAEKCRAIENAAAAGLGVVLVPVIAPGINDAQVGDIIRFALERQPGVRGVHFQPISYFGRCAENRPANPITIPRMLRLIEEQTGGEMKAEDFGSGGAENPYCSFHAAYRNGRPLPKKSGSCCCSTTSDDSRSNVAEQWSGAKTEAEDPFDEFINEVHNSKFEVSGMLFQDAYNFDLERIKRCYICEMDSHFGMVPFCAYNLTNVQGEYLYRR